MKEPLAQSRLAERRRAWSVPRGDGDACGIEPQAHRQRGPAWERPGARPADFTRRAALATVGLALLGPAHGAPELTGLQLRGQGRFRYFGLSIYDVRLWSAEPVAAASWSEQKLTLELQYARTLVGREIAKRSLAEMRRQAAVTDAQAQAWLQEMETAFPDVKAGDRLSGQYEPGAAASFFFNGQPRQRIADAQFARLFFGIWLSPQTSEPALRAQLLGGGDAIKR